MAVESKIRIGTKVVTRFSFTAQIHTIRRGRQAAAVLVLLPPVTTATKLSQAERAAGPLQIYRGRANSDITVINMA